MLRQALILLVFGGLSNFEAVEAAVPTCNSGLGLQSGQTFCLFSNYSKYDAPIEFYGQSKINMTVLFAINDVQVDEDNVYWTARLIASISWPDNRIIMSTQKSRIALTYDVVETLWLPSFVTNSYESLHPASYMEVEFEHSRPRGRNLYFVHFNHKIASSKALLFPSSLNDSLSVDLKNDTTANVELILTSTFTNYCPNISFWNYPFDGFTCSFYLRPRNLEASEAVLTGTIKVDEENQLPSKFSIEYKALTENYADFLGINYSIVGFTVEFSRANGVYFNEFYLPMLCFVIASFASFTLPPLDGNDRTCMLITLFLVNVQMALYISDDSPETDGVHALSLFTTSMIAFIFLAILEYLIILARLNKSRHDQSTADYQSGLEFAHRLDKVSLVLFPVALTLFVIIYALYYGVYSRSVDILDGRATAEL